MTDFFDQLALRCPTLFRQGALRCGGDCPVGWESLVLDLSVRLEAHARENNPELLVDQVKSKFGGLRYYVSNHDPVAEEMIAPAEKKSRTLCETCGAEGKQTGRGWVVTACPEHAL